MIRQYICLKWCEKHDVDISLYIEVVGINDRSGDQGAGRTTKVENVPEYDLMGIVREAGSYYVEVVPLNGVNSMIRGEKVSSGGVWLTPKN